MRKATGVRVIKRNKTGTAPNAGDRPKKSIAPDRSQIALRRAYRLAKLCDWTWRPEKPLPDQALDDRLGQYEYTPEVSAVLGLDAEALNAAGSEGYALACHPEDVEKAKRDYQEFLTSNAEHFWQHFRVLTPVGEIRHVRVLSEKRRDAAGLVMEVAGTIQDVTDITRAEIGMRQIEAILTSAHKLARIGYWFWDGGTKHDDQGSWSKDFHYSAEATAVTGISESEIRSMSTAQFCRRHVHVGDYARVLALLRDFYEGRTDQFSHEYRHLHPNGRELIILSSAKRERDEAGRPLYAVGLLQDITAQKLDEISLRQAHQKLADAQRIGHIGNWSSDFAAKSLVWSDEVYRIFGYQPGDSRPPRALLNATVHPDDLPMVEQATQKSILDRVPYAIEYRIVQPSGEIRHVREQAELIFDIIGQPVRHEGVLIDITENRMVEEKLRQSAAALGRAHRLAKLCHWTWTPTAPVGRSVIDNAMGVYEYSDESADIFGFSAEALAKIGPRFAEGCVVPEDRKIAGYEFNVFAGSPEASLSQDYRIQRPDGQIRYVRAMSEKIFDSDGNITQMVGTIQDITQTKERELELAQAKLRAELADRAKSTLLANMSHELRTPLNAVLGFADVLKQQLFGPVPPAYNESVDAIASSGRHLLSIINDLLEMSRLDISERKLIEDVFDAEAALRDCLRMLTPRAQEGAVLLSYQADPPCPPIFGEERAFKQVIINLLTNAIKFTPKDGKVEIRLDRSDPESLRVIVEDSGVGIASEVLPRLGRPFAQADDVLSRRHGGVGLGLAISKRLMELHGGRLEIDSQPGIGTKVTVILPASRIRVVNRPAILDQAKTGR